MNNITQIYILISQCNIDITLDFMTACKSSAKLDDTIVKDIKNIGNDEIIYNSFEDIEE